MVCRRRHFVKALVRWVTYERLTNHLPKLSLITLSPPLNSGILGLRMGPYVPNPRFFYNLWGPRESDSSGSLHWKPIVISRAVSCPADDAICEGISPLGYWQEVNQSPTQTKPYNITRLAKLKLSFDHPSVALTAGVLSAFIEK